MKTARQWFRAAKRCEFITPTKVTRQQYTRYLQDQRKRRRFPMEGPSPDCNDELREWEDDWDDSEWCATCNSTGFVDCHCGGDLCVCMNMGEMPCPNCGY